MKKLFVFLTCLSIITIAKSQNPPCQPHYSGLTIPIQQLTYVPPLRTDMPTDVILGYIILDSLRHNSTYKGFHEFMKNQTFNDTVRYLLKYRYEMIDYNPFLYYLFYDFGDLCRNPIMLIDEEINAKISDVSPDNLTTLLNYSDIIAHIMVIDTTRIYDSSAQIYPRTMIVKCDILDTIKGKIIPSCPENYHFLKMDTIITIPSTGCIQFEYCLDWPKQNITNDVVIIGTDSLPWTNIQPKLVDSLDIPCTKKNYEYIVFLKIMVICKDSNNHSNFYTLSPIGIPSSNHGMYPIINGNVYDYNNDLGFGTVVPTSVFINNIKSMIFNIINFGY